MHRLRRAASEAFLSPLLAPSWRRPRVGVQLHGSSPLRTYPAESLTDLLRHLVRRGVEAHLFGAKGEGDTPSAPPLFHNWCGRTDEIELLIALIEQMDVLLGPDSSLVHLGGSMGIPTVGMFTVVPSRLRTQYYTSVRALEPSIGCNPCFGRGICPDSHDHCLMWDQPMLSPEALADEVCRCLADAGGPLTHAANSCGPTTAR
ncbi:MAG: hypothetical protein IID37_05230 [Planctomycetes bacterium]|nr:hypothetical protein [Planctomycetota bacterium]